MYSSDGTRYEPPPVPTQQGGDYISTISSISTMSTISISTLSAIVAMAGLQQISSIAGLTTDQINALLGSIDRQIDAEGKEIERLQGEITRLDREINTDPNYIRQFADVSEIYWSVSKRYSSLQSTIDATNQDIASKQLNLSTLSTQAGQYLSSFNGYDSIYRNLLSSFQSVNVLLLGQIAAYNGEIQQISSLNSFIGSTLRQRDNPSLTPPPPATRTFRFTVPPTTATTPAYQFRIRVPGGNTILFFLFNPTTTLWANPTTSFGIYQRTANNLNITSYPLSQLGITASGTQPTITILANGSNFVISSSSTATGVTPITYLSNSAFLTNGLYDVGSLSWIQTETTILNLQDIPSQRLFLDTTIRNLSASRVQEERNASTILSNISTYAYMSTLQALSTGFFQSVFFYWSTMEAYAISSVNGYTSLRDGLIQQQTDLNTEINDPVTGLRKQLNDRLATIDSDAKTFYDKKTTEFSSGVDEISYALQEYSAGFGVLTAELLIKKLNLDDEIDMLSFRIQQNVAAGVPSGTDSATRTAKMGDSGRLQDVITTLNPVETSYRYIIDNVLPIEKKARDDFIKLRKTMHDTERQVLETPSLRPSIQTNYNANWTTLAGHVTNINNQVNARYDIMFRNTDNVSTKVGQVKERLDTLPLNAYMDGLTFPVIDDSLKMDRINSQLINPDAADRTKPASAFALLPPINFDMSVPPFPTTNP